MDIVKNILDNIINYSLFFLDDEIIKEEQLDKYIIYLNKKINNNNCNLFFEEHFSIINVDGIITLRDYINRLFIGFNISNSIMIGAIIYLERLDIHINIYNIHKLILISLLLSSKFLEDLTYKNKYWAKYGGLSIARLNKLEIIYLKKIKNNLFIHTNEFYDKFNDIYF
jgi:hypothetical protein